MLRSSCPTPALPETQRNVKGLLWPTAGSPTSSDRQLQCPSNVLYKTWQIGHHKGWDFCVTSHQNKPWQNSPVLLFGLLFQRLFQTKVAFQVKTSLVYGRVYVCGCLRVVNVHCVHVPRVAKSVHSVHDDVGGVIIGLGDEGSWTHLILSLASFPSFLFFLQAVGRCHNFFLPQRDANKSSSHSL